MDNINNLFAFTGEYVHLVVIHYLHPDDEGIGTIKIIPCENRPTAEAIADHYNEKANRENNEGVLRADYIIQEKIIYMR